MDFLRSDLLDALVKSAGKLLRLPATAHSLLLLAEGSVHYRLVSGCERGVLHRGLVDRGERRPRWLQGVFTGSFFDGGV